MGLGAWWGSCIPKNTPADIKAKAQENFKKAVHSKKVKDMLAKRTGGLNKTYERFL